MTNDTCDDNMPATVTSTVSVNVRTEEPSEVPEISTSSTFFDKNDALSSSSCTFLTARENMDTKEINLPDHSLVDFDFDPRKK